jgi:small subunit ribosomal protein S18
MTDQDRPRGPRGPQGNGDEGGDDRRGRGGRGGRFGGPRRPRVCLACTEGVKSLDYKQADVLRRYITERGKIKPRRQTGMCATHQRVLSTSIKRARHLALLPFRSERGPR